ncbi:MAG: hypothetical protein KAR19_03605 [Bacteroidales bacterium]|nr:hypothetical protein [Bacteroidales bacterium]
MKLVSVKKTEQLRTASKFKPALSVNGKNGSIAFNKKAIEHFHLKPGYHIDFLKDEEQSPPEWYFKAIQEGNDDTFKLGQGTGRLQFTSKPLAHEIIRCVQKREHPHNDESELNTNIMVRFHLATKPAMDGDQEIPNTYAIMGGKIIE